MKSSESLTRIHRPDGDNADHEEGGHDEQGGQDHAEDHMKIFVIWVCERDGLHRIAWFFCVGALWRNGELIGQLICFWMSPGKSDSRLEFGALPIVTAEAD